MKTAISIPDDVFEQADELAKQLGFSRSQLYANAVAEYVAKHRMRDITTRLNEVYGTESAALDATTQRAQLNSVKSSEW
ncbi:MAG: ribbon-helix-helix domain-containing protein [Gemmatimonadota bacterium]